MDKIEKLKEFVELCSEGALHGLMVLGGAGIGKSYNVLTTLENSLKHEEYIYINAYATPLELYNFLYQHRNKRVIVLDDVEGLLAEKRGLSLLKALLWSVTKDRKVFYLTTSAKLKAPKSFIMKASLIFCMNKLPKDVHFQAVASRCIQYELSFTYKEKLNIIQDICKEQNIPDEVFKFIKDNSNETTELNFRVLIQIHAIQQKREENWQELALEMLKNDDDLLLIKNLVTKCQTIEEASKEFTKQTGKSRRTFFRYKKVLDKNAK